MVRGELRGRFIETLTELGGSAGNKRLHEALGWAESTYWDVHSALIEAGVITAGRGRGGSVALSRPVEKAPESNGAAPAVAVSQQPPRRAQPEKRQNGNGANLGFEAQLFLAADKLRKNLEPSDYKHVALGLIFLKYISIAFEAKRASLLAEDPAAAEDPDEYLAENVFWVPKEARWSHLQANAKQPTIGKLIDDAMAAGATAGVVNPPLVRLQHLDKHADHRTRRVELATALALRAREATEEVLVDPAEEVLGLVARFAHRNPGYEVDQFAEHHLVEGGPCPRTTTGVSYSSSGSRTTAGSSDWFSSSSSSSSTSSSSSLGSRGGIVLTMMVTGLQSTNQVEEFSGMREVMSAPVGCRDNHSRRF